MSENYQRYLELIENFYQSKNHYLGNDSKHKKCDECKNDKIYIENEKEIILSCGETGKCGKKIDIILPKYINKDREIELLKSELEKVIDWDIINKHIKIESEFLKDNRELIENNNKQIQEIKNKYYEIYKKNNVRLIKEKYKEIHKLKEEIQDIKIKLSDISLSIDDKKLLRKEYINKNTEINNLYSEIRENKENIVEYYLDSEPVIKIDKLDIIEKNVKKKKKVKGDISKFKVGMKVSFTSKGKEYKGDITNIIADKNKVVVKIGNKEVNVPVSKINIIKDDKKEDKKEKPIEDKSEKEKSDNDEPIKDDKPDEPDEPVKEDEPNEPEKEGKIEVGSKVKWTDKSTGKLLKGTVEKETANSYKICCKPGKNSGDKNSVYQVNKSLVSHE